MSVGRLFKPKETKPFDEKQHAEHLRTGRMQFHVEETSKHIHIDKRTAFSKGNGFGTASMRHIVQYSFEQKCEGNIISDTSYSSHIFHLYMGMIPLDRKVDYVETKYGFVGRGALEKLREYYGKEKSEELDEESDEESDEELDDYNPFGSMEMSLLSSMLKHEKNLPQNKKINFTDILKNRDFLLALNKKEATYLRDRFIPLIIDHFKSANCRNPIEKFPSTEYFYGIKMKLSEEGIKRWKEAIDRGIEFEKFQYFEQLSPFMSTKQREELNKLLDERYEKLSKAQEKEATKTMGRYN